MSFPDESSLKNVTVEVVELSFPSICAHTTAVINGNIKKKSMAIHIFHAW